LETDRTIVLQGRNLVKRFGDLTAVDEVNVSLRKKEIGALLGENGAGKSTYLKMLNGYLKPTSGTIYYDGEEIKFSSAHDAAKRKIYTIYQNFALIDKFTIRENLQLTFPDKSQGELQEMVTRHGKTLNLDVRVGTLPAGIKQRLEIIKALESKAKVLLLDEPTSVLAYEERDQLFKDLARLGQERDMAILVTTHKLQDALDYCKRVMVMKAGRLIMEKVVSQTGMTELTTAMFGASEEFHADAEVASNSESNRLIDVRNLSVRGDNVPLAVHGANFSIYRGEILGIIGIAGNGQVELADAIYGLRAPAAGSVRPSEEFTKSGRKLRVGRLAFVSDEPIQVGLAAELSVRENFGISLVQQFFDGPIIDWNALDRFASGAIQKYEIKCNSTDELLRELSGGNIQKVLISREFERNVDVLIAIHPARGLDLHTTYLVYRRLKEIANSGTAILLISEDIDEVMELADRIGAIYEGLLSDLRPRSQWSRQSLGASMTGVELPS